MIIDTLNMTLPGHYAEQASHIGRMVGEELAALPSLSLSNTHIVSLDVPEVHVEQGWSPHLVAQKIAGAIHQQLSGQIPWEEKA